MSQNIKVKQRRAVIFAKDIQNFTGLAGRSARRMLENVRKAMGKKKEALVTIKEFCEFYEIDESVLREYLID
jgi:hypothetical protein